LQNTRADGPFSRIEWKKLKHTVMRKAPKGNLIKNISLKPCLLVAKLVTGEKSEGGFKKSVPESLLRSSSRSSPALRYENSRKSS